jgi:hypothetical protein
MPLNSKPSNYNLRSTLPETEEATVIEETVMSAHPAFRLESFRGDGAEDIERYLRRFEQYQACTGIKDEQAFATLIWYLDGHARLWIESLVSPPTTLGGLKAALKEKYKVNKPIDLNIFLLKQNHNENVEQYIHRLENALLLQKNRVDDAIAVQIALSGMDRNIGSAVSTHNPKNLDQVKDIASRMTIAPAISVNAVDKITQPTAIESAVEVLTAAVAKLTTTVEERNSGTSRQSDHMGRQYHYRHRDNQGNGAGTQGRKQTVQCRRCGGRCLSRNLCRAIGKVCYKCNGADHFGNVCENVRQQNNFYRR